MQEQDWIGIQFNLDRDMGLEAWLESYKKQGIETDGEHITIKFGKNELKKLGDGDSAKINLMKSALKKCLERSDYTNVYTYLDAESVGQYKSKLLDGELSEPIRVSDLKNKHSILDNYDSDLQSPHVRKILKKDRLMIAMNELFDFLANRDFGLNQKLTLEIAYEDKEEWGAERDNLNVSIQLDIVEQ